MNALIYTIAIHDEYNREGNKDVLRKLASMTGGTSFFLRTAGEATGALDQIAREIRSGYLVGYVPREDAAGYRQVRVRVRPADSRKLAVRRGWIRPGGEPMSVAWRPRLQLALRIAERLLLSIAAVSLGYVALTWMATARDQASLARELDRAEHVAAVTAPGAGVQPADRRVAPARGELVGRIAVPRLGVSAIAREGADAKTLRRAVGHVPDTALPGQKGNAALPAIATRSSASCSTSAPANGLSSPPPRAATSTSSVKHES